MLSEERGRSSGQTPPPSYEDCIDRQDSNTHQDTRANTLDPPPTYSTLSIHREEVI